MYDRLEIRCYRTIRKYSPQRNVMADLLIFNFLSAYFQRAREIALKIKRSVARGIADSLKHDLCKTKDDASAADSSVQSVYAQHSANVRL